MTYRLTKSDGTLLSIVQDTKVDNTTSLSIPGRGVQNYGDIISSDLIYLLENFSSPIPPKNPIDGQLWFKSFDNSDSNNVVTVNRLFIYYNKDWHDIGGVITGDNPPEKPSNGVLWLNDKDNLLYYYLNGKWHQSSNMYTSQDPMTISTGISDGTPWLMQPEGMLWIYDSTISSPSPAFTRYGGKNNGIDLTGSWRLIGPELPSNTGIYSSYKVVKDTSGNQHVIKINYYNGSILSIDSDTEFKMDITSSDSIKNFNSYNKDLTIPNDYATIYSGNTLNTKINSDYLCYGGFALSAYNLDGFDSSDVIGRGGNTTLRPTYPIDTDITDLGSKTHRWNNLYAKSVYADNLFLNGDQVSTQKWTTSNFVKQRENTVADYDITMAGKNKQSNLCWLYDSDNNIYHYLPDQDQVKSICLPLDVGGIVYGHTTISTIGTYNGTNIGGLVGSEIKGDYINNYNVGSTINQTYSFKMGIQHNSSTSYGTLTLKGWNGDKSWIFRDDDNTIVDPSGAVIATQLWTNQHCVRNGSPTDQWGIDVAVIDKSSNTPSFRDGGGTWHILQPYGNYVTPNSNVTFNSLWVSSTPSLSDNGTTVPNTSWVWQAIDQKTSTYAPSSGTFPNGSWLRVGNIIIQSFVIDDPGEDGWVTLPIRLAQNPSAVQVNAVSGKSGSDPTTSDWDPGGFRFHNAGHYENQYSFMVQGII